MCFFSKLIKHERIPEQPGLWIPDSSVIWIPDSTVWIPDSKTLDSGFLNQQKVGFRIPDYLTRGDNPIPNTFLNYSNDESYCCF